MDMKPNPALCGTEDVGATALSSCAVSWSSILAGSVAAAALSLTLLVLGSGLGLSVASPWAGGPTMTEVTTGVIIWLIIMQWASAGIGGYLTGRLRHKWSRTHEDEVFFRDTAHGFITWCVSALFTAAVLTAAVSSVIGTGTQAAATVAAGAMEGHKDMRGPARGPGMAEGGPFVVYVDTLFRREQMADAAAPVPPADPEARGEVFRILISDVKAGSFPEADKTYLAQVVSARTGLAQDAALKRVDDVLLQVNAAEVKAAETADKARKAAAALSVFSALAMFIGAFIAAVAAVLGGRCRDRHH